MEQAGKAFPCLLFERLCISGMYGFFVLLNHCFQNNDFRGGSSCKDSTESWRLFLRKTGVMYELWNMTAKEILAVF